MNIIKWLFSPSPKKTKAKFRFRYAKQDGSRGSIEIENYNLRGAYSKMSEVKDFVRVLGVDRL